jgi:hypothetical protein
MTYLDEVLALLWPEGSTVDAEYIVVPNASQPKLLVPAGDRRLAAAAVRRYARPRSRRARLKRSAVQAALRTGLHRLLLPDRVRVATGPDSIRGYLSRALDVDPAISVHIGPPRANRKPVLQLLSADRQTVGFAKLGTNALTRELVRAESAALAALGNAGLRKVTVPRVLHTGRWNGHEVLVQSPLAIWQPPVPLTEPRLAAAMHEVAVCCGVRRGPLDGSGYWNRLRARLSAISEHPEGRQLAETGTRLVDRSGRRVLAYGSWHGDWAPWNMASLADALLVWDWERFATGVPVGFDALHHELQRRIADGRGGRAGPGSPEVARVAVESTLAGARRLLLPFGVHDAADAETIALLYLLELATRYVADRQAEAGARLGVLGTWLLPALLQRVEGS